MYFNKAKYSAAALVLLSTFSSAISFAGGMGSVHQHFKGHFLVQLGGFSAVQGKEQNISIAENLVGNRYTVTTHNQGSGLVGLGYLVDGPVFKERFPIYYGIDVFFLGQTSVHGYIIEENTFTNLSYRYKTQSIPLYFTAKTVLNTNSDKFKLVFDAGVGPNFMNVSHYNEMALTTYTISDNAFSDRNNVTVSATVGAGIRFNNAPDRLPIECGYRFFYLGQGEFTVNNNQVLNTIKTGNNYANAVVCTVTI